MDDGQEALLSEEDRGFSSQHEPEQSEGDVRKIMKRVAIALEVTLSNYGLALTLLFSYLLLNLLFFLYGAELEISHNYPDFRSWLLPLGRGCGVMLNLNAPLLLLSMCRILWTKLRSTPLGVLFPFEKMVLLHKLVAINVVLSSLIHGLGQLLTYLIRWNEDGQWQIADPSELAQAFSPLTSHTSVFTTGIILLLILILIAATSLPYFRRTRHFRFFYYTHKLYILFYILLVMHGVQNGVPITWIFLAIPLILYIADFLFSRFIVRSNDVSVLAADILPGKILRLRMKRPSSFRFECGQHVHLRVPQVSPFEWHPFTLASAPSDPDLLLFIKAEGDWTSAVHHYFARVDFRINDEGLIDDEENDIDDNASGTVTGSCRPITVSLRGPFGSPAQHVSNFDSAVLVAGGVGATPFLSTIRHIHNMQQRSVSSAGESKSVTQSYSTSFGSPLTVRRKMDEDEADVEDSLLEEMNEEQHDQLVHSLKDWKSEEEDTTRTPLAMVHSSPLEHAPVRFIVRAYLHSVSLLLLSMWMLLAYMFIVIATPIFIGWDDNPVWLQVLRITLNTSVALHIFATVLADIFASSHALRRPSTWLQFILALVIIAFNVLSELVLTVFHSHVDKAIVFIITQVATILLIVIMYIRFYFLVIPFVALAPYHTKREDRLHKVTFVWVTRVSDESEWLLRELREIKKRDSSGLFTFIVYMTRERSTSFLSSLFGLSRSDTGDIALSPLDISDSDTHTDTTLGEHAVSCRAGRPSWSSLFEELSLAESNDAIVGLFFCGANAMARCVRIAAAHASITGMRYDVAAGSLVSNIRYVFRKCD